MLEIDQIAQWLREVGSSAAADLVSACSLNFDFADLLPPIHGGQEVEYYNVVIQTPGYIFKDINSTLSKHADDVESAIKGCAAGIGFEVKRINWVPLVPTSTLESSGTAVVPPDPNLDKSAYVSTSATESNESVVRIFISYAKEDAPAAQRLYADLLAVSADPWLDTECLLPGQRWREAIEKAIREADYFVALISSSSVNKRGYVQREVRKALDVLSELSDSKIFVIPARLDESTPDHQALRDLQWVDLFPSWGDGVTRILKSIVEDNAEYREKLVGYLVKHELPESLFDMRISYFKAEKRFLAESFGRLLFARARKLIEDSGAPVVFFLDSGTTIFPFFKYLAESAVKSYTSGEPWIRKGMLSIVTNCIPGVTSFVKSASIGRLRVHSQTALPLTQLPGQAHGNYWAVTGDDTVEAIENLRSGNNIVVALTTGNWIRITQDRKPLPIPLVRGGVHGPIKSTALRVAHESYVVAPLGKILARISLEQLNSTLREEEDIGYGELDFEGLDVLPSLVSTGRAKADPLSGLTAYLHRRLSARAALDEVEFIRKPLGVTDHVLFAYKHPDNSPERDFPDPRTRTPEFTKWFTDFEN